MANKVVQVRVRHLRSLAILDLGGDITREGDRGLTAAYEEAAALDAAGLVLNFTRVEYINSTGIALLVGLLARAKAEGRRVYGYGLSEHYQEIFHITRLADFMTLYTDEEAAISGLKSKEVPS